MVRLHGWRYGVFVGAIVGSLGLAFYPIVVYPMLHKDEYREMQSRNRAGVRQEDIQPGNMKVWSDPFDRPKPDKHP